MYLNNFLAHAPSSRVKKQPILQILTDTEHNDYLKFYICGIW